MKNIIGMHFDTKSYLKSTRNHTAKHAHMHLLQEPGTAGVLLPHLDPQSALSGG